ATAASRTSTRCPSGRWSRSSGTTGSTKSSTTTPCGSSSPARGRFARPVAELEDGGGGGGAADALRDEYIAATRNREKGLAAIDAYLGDSSARDQPLVVFHHVKKTAGTALRLIAYGNYGKHGYTIAPLRKRTQSHAWWRDF